VQLRQPKRGYRVSSDAVILAALAPVLAGQTVLELGTGYGQVALCLACRVPGCVITAIELLPEVASLAEQNVELNGRAAHISIHRANVKDLQLEQRFNWVLANPPYRCVEGHDLSPIAAKNYANYEMDGVPLLAWAQAAARHLQQDGAALFIFDAVRQADLMQALQQAGLGQQVVLPIISRAGDAARRVAIMAKAGAEKAVWLPPLVTHGAEQGWDPAIERVYRDAAGLSCFAEVNPFILSAK